ncbi:MAG: S-methyl-5-thioribose-1-phosphate isomerase [Dehalococcoidia bacterium]|nr:S-methyl-5-thioribose-1-phosphate isomerase [Dehalococcoidia bacterium]
MTYSVEWIDNKLQLLDQSRLPHEERYDMLTTVAEVADAIRTMKVRGAPAIGVAAAYGVVLAARQSERADTEARTQTIVAAIEELETTRPTAVNLFSALNRMRAALARPEPADITSRLMDEAVRIHDDEKKATTAMSTYGASLVPEGATVLTHCNAGAIATAAHGTALGVIIHAYRMGRVKRVIATETRPLLQGARLTVWELVQEGIPTTLITDSMVGHVMHTQAVDCVIVGADRIASNGDVANKIGTYGIAVLAHAHHVPFYVAAPFSTIDMGISDGGQIPIEQRRVDEVTSFGGQPVAAGGSDVLNPSFDVTPNSYVTSIITERGILSSPYLSRLKTMVENHDGKGG